MVASLVNKDNSHVGGLLSSNQGAVKGFGGKVIGSDGTCKGIKQYGGKKHKKRTHKKKSKKRVHKRSMRNKRKSKSKKHKIRKSKKHHKKHNRKQHKKSRKHKKRGGAVLEPHKPMHGLHSILTRGGNASRGLSHSEKAKLIGGGNAHGISITGYKNCNITPDFKHGAGTNWKSLHRMQMGAGIVDTYNNMTSGAYGYVPEGDNRSFAGSYPPVKPISRAQQCGKGGKRKKKRGGKKQRGGYAQYQSNVAMTHTQQIPNGAQGGNWQGQLANPPTFSRANLCRDNYNHFTRKTMRSPVLDQDVKA